MNDGRFVETFLVDSWLEHLRQHERVTKADCTLQIAVDRFQRKGVPKVTHLIAADLVRGTRTVRYRDGAVFWACSRMSPSPDRYIEYSMVESMVENTYDSIAAQQTRSAVTWNAPRGFRIRPSPSYRISPGRSFGTIRQATIETTMQLRKWRARSSFCVLCAKGYLILHRQTRIPRRFSAFAYR